MNMVEKARPKTISGYERIWKRAVRDLWRTFRVTEPIRVGERRAPGRVIYTLFSWQRDMSRNIRDYLTVAWEKGAAEFGIKPDEFTEAERAELRNLLNRQADTGYLENFYRDALSKFRQRPRAKASSMYPRVQLWVNRWNEVLNRSKAVFGKNRKMKWVLGETHDHCRTCFGFDGRVYRASTWEENGALPQAHALECEGYNCLCRLEETTERITPGRFPKGLLAK